MFIEVRNLVHSKELKLHSLYVRTERINRSLHGVNENFEHRPSITCSSAVDPEQALRSSSPTLTRLV